MDVEFLEKMLEVGRFLTTDYKESITELEAKISDMKGFVGISDTVEKANQFLATAQKEQATAEGLVQKARDELSAAETRANKIGQEVQVKAESMVEDLRAEILKEKEVVAATLADASISKGKYRELNTKLKKEITDRESALDEKASNLTAWEKDLEARGIRVGKAETALQEKQEKLAGILGS